MTPEETLQKEFPWLLSAFTKLDLNLRELGQALSDEGSESEERESALISSAELLCQTIRGCRERGLFEAAAADLNSLGKHRLPTLQLHLREHLAAILVREEAILVAAGLDPRAARDLRGEMERIHPSKLTDSRLYNIELDHLARLAAEDVCHKFPKSSIDFRIKGMRNAVQRVKGKYGVVGGLVVAAANVVVMINVPEPMLVTKFSKILGVALSSSADIFP